MLITKEKYEENPSIYSNPCDEGEQVDRNGKVHYMIRVNEVFDDDGGYWRDVRDWDF